MSLISGSSVTGSSGGPSQYTIERSLRFNSADSAYLNRTPASASNRKTWTWSGWVKRSAFGGTQSLFARNDGSVASYIIWNSNNKLEFSSASGSVEAQIITTPVYRDASAWYHVIMALDTTQATSSNRVKFYVNGVQVTALDTASYPSQNYDGYVNTTQIHYIGAGGFGGSLTGFFNGYLTEINFIDGSALTPTDFGEFNSTTGVWQPIEYTGSYGTNGFYLNFSDNASTTTLGDDLSGNGNDWTTNNFSVTAGAGNDSLVDTPTNYGTDTGVGGEVRGNYATLNPLRPTSSGSFANGNLDGVNETSTPSRGLCSTIALPWSGKWYAEVTFTSSIYNWCGVTANAFLAADINTSGQQSVLYYAINGNKYVNGSATAYGASYTTETIGIAFDGPNTQITFYKAGVSQGAITLPSSTVDYVFCQGNAAGVGTTGSWNFGQRPFAYTAPSGFKALCTQNLPEPTIVDGGEYFNTVLYTGNGSTQSITGVGFQPDMVWLKARNAAYNHGIQDAVRGVGKTIYPNLTNAEDTGSTSLTAFNSNGFGLGNDSWNESGKTYVAWNWKANGAGVAGDNGSTISANTTAGFCIVKYTGNGDTSSSAPLYGIGGIGAPDLIIYKRLNSTSGWTVQSRYGITSITSYYLLLNSTAAEASAGTTVGNFGSTGIRPRWTDATNGNNINGATYVAYVFAPVAGYSAFGSYTGNGSADGPFIYTGFRPRYLLMKSSSATGDWYVWDTTRSPYNVVELFLRPNSSAAESSPGQGYFDLLSNGFKLRANSSDFGNGNTNGNTYIYAAFAESPFKYSLGR